MLPGIQTMVAGVDNKRVLQLTERLQLIEYSAYFAIDRRRSGVVLLMFGALNCGVFCDGDVRLSMRFGKLLPGNVAEGSILILCY